MTDLSRLVSRGGALALLVLVVLFLAMGIVAPALRHFADLTERAEEATRLTRAFEERLAGTEQVIERLPEGLVYRDLAVPLVAADLQRTATLAVERAGGTPVSSLSLDPEPDGDVLRLAVRVTANFDIVSLSAFLLDVEDSTPLLLVEELSVTQRPPEEPRGPVTLSVGVTLLTFLDQPSG